MNYRLLAAVPDDENWLEDLRRQVYQELFYATWGGWDEARHHRHFAACLAREHIFVIEREGRRAGMVQIFEAADALEVGELQIQPDGQNRGLGTAVLRDLIARAQGAGKSVKLSLGLKNHKAYRLYQRLGFRCVERTETHFHMICEPSAPPGA